MVAVEAKRGATAYPVEDSIEELAQLAGTAGAEVVGKLTQKLSAPSKTHYLGKGKLDELLHLREDIDYNVAIFDDELSPLQQRNLEELLQVKVIDRAALILDIFSRRARTHEGRLQVELAQHQYLLPRLAGQWSHLERLGAGIGTRGPGESQIETDRRLIKQKIHRLKDQIEQVRKHRALYRKQRKKKGIPIVALVGYTNAGKSTLFNKLSRADVFVEDKLFATLDPITRRVILPDKSAVLITDTVGFIQKLPPILVTAFRATLEELEEADLLLHIVDVSRHDSTEQCQTVEGILHDLKLDGKPTITVLNKIDLLLPGDSVWNEETLKIAAAELPPVNEEAIIISAIKGYGLPELLELIKQTLAMSAQPV
ncbi:GTPase HflX [Bacteroidota bacterium]